MGAGRDAASALAAPLARSRCRRTDRLETLRGGRVLREGQKRGDKVGPSRAGKTSKRHFVVEGNGLPLACHLAEGNVADITAAPLALAQVKVPRRRGRPRTRPVGLAADRGYDGKAFRLSLVRRGIRHSIPLRRAPYNGKLKYRPHTHRDLSGNRWVVERFFAWLNGFRRITQRFERYAFMYEALLHLACCWICLRRLLQ